MLIILVHFHSSEILNAGLLPLIKYFYIAVLLLLLK